MVPDERAIMLDRMQRLIDENQIVFVTGGLGPTSDDFTREIISKVSNQELQFSAEAYGRLCKILETRKVPIRESHRQQCYFPKSAEIFLNPVGTADAFGIKVGKTFLVALPGPPQEIHGTWSNGLEDFLKSNFSKTNNERLSVWRTLGLPESEVAEIAERILKDTGLRIGYRAHVPYVDLKIWFQVNAQGVRTTSSQLIFENIDKELSPWTCQRSDTELSEQILINFKEQNLRMVDLVTEGLIAEKLSEACNEKNLDWPKDLLVLTGKQPLKEQNEQSSFRSEAWLLKTNKIEFFFKDGSREYREAIDLPSRLSLNRTRRKTYLAEVFLRKCLEFFKNS